MKITSVGTHKEEVLNKWLMSKLKQIPGGSRILDAGAGEMQFKKYCEHLKYVSQDLATYDGKGDGKGLHPSSWAYDKLDIISDITLIPEPDESFDAIMCVEVFEHIPSPLLALKEFSRLLRTNGHLIITAPFTSTTHFAPYHFYSGFNHYFYETHLPANGFEIKELRCNGNYFEFIALELRRLESIAVRYAKDQIRPWEKIAALIVKLMLSRFSSKDSGSSEVYNCGIMVYATKK